MGERGQEATEAATSAPAAAVVAAGFLVGAALISPVVLNATGDDGGEPVAAVAPDESTTTELTEPSTTTVVVTTTAAPTTTTIVVGPLPATLTAVSSSSAAGPEPFDADQAFSGSSVTCAGDACSVSIVAANIVGTAEVTLVDGVGSSTFRWSVPEDADCGGLGTVEGGGTIELRREGSGFAGDVTVTSDNFSTVGACSGATATFTLAAA